MLSQAEAIIYLASQRGCSQDEHHRSYYTFNFGSYVNESRKAFGNLRAINDEALAPGKSLTLYAQEDAIILLLPIVGSLSCRNELSQTTINVGQCFSFRASGASSFNILNHYSEEPINFLHIWFTPESKNSTYSSLADFELNRSKNKLVTLLETDHLQVSLGKFKGREEGKCILQDSTKGAFVFVIEGAFEVNNRLLEPRDGLAIWNTQWLEFEALSNEAIILILEA